MKYLMTLLSVFIAIYLINGCSSDLSSSNGSANAIVSEFDSEGRLSANTYAQYCKVSPSSYDDAIKNLMVLANVENEVYADILLTFSEGGTKPLFALDVDIGENSDIILDKNYNALLLRTSDLYTQLDACYESTILFLGTRNTSAKERGALSAIAKFFGFMSGTISHTRDTMVSIGASNKYIRQEMLDNAKRTWREEDFGNDADVFYEKIKKGDYDNKLNHLHNNLYHDPDTQYYNEVDRLKEQPIAKVMVEAKNGIEAGVELYVESAKIITGPLAEGDGFSKGYDYAKDAIAVINKTEEKGFFGGLYEYLTIKGKKVLGDKYKEFLQSKAHLGDIINDGIKDGTEEMIKSLGNYLGNMTNYIMGSSEKEKVIHELKVSGDTSDTNTKVITLTPNIPIIKPNLGLLIALNSKGDYQVNVVKYPENNEEILLNVNEDDFTYLNILFSNENDDMMGEKNIPITAVPEIDVTIFSEIKIFKPIEVNFVPHIVEQTATYTIYDVDVLISNISQPTHIKAEASEPVGYSISNLAYLIDEDRELVWNVKVKDKDVDLTISVSFDGEDYSQKYTTTVKSNIVKVIEQPPVSGGGGSNVYSGTYVGYGDGCPTSGTLSFKFSSSSVSIISSNIAGGGTTSISLQGGRIFNGQDAKNTYWAGALSDANAVEGVFSDMSTGCGGEYHISN